MNLRPKAVAGYIIGWGIVIGFVVLLTMIFSFLGTIICAAVAGMMVGAARLPRWPSAGVSLICPGVIVAVLRLSRAELDDRQIIFLALLCFALYWLFYLGLFKLVSTEQVQCNADARSKAKTSLICSDGNHSGAIPCQAGTATLAHPAEPAVLTLEAVQGTWIERVSRRYAQRPRILIIKEQTLVLSQVSDRGTMQTLGSGVFKVTAGATTPFCERRAEEVLLDLESQVCI